MVPVSSSSAVTFFSVCWPGPRLQLQEQTGGFSVCFSSNTKLKSPIRAKTVLLNFKYCKYPTVHRAKECFFFFLAVTSTEDLVGLQEPMGLFLFRFRSNWEIGLFAKCSQVWKKKKPTTRWLIINHSGRSVPPVLRECASACPSPWMSVWGDSPMIDPDSYLFLLFTAYSAVLPDLQ